MIELKKVTVTFQYDEEKYKAVKMYLEKKGKSLDDEITGFIDTLFTKHIPATVREYFEMKNSTSDENK